MAKMKALRRDEDIAAVPLDEPVLVELDPGPPSPPTAKADERPEAPEPEVDDGDAVKAMRAQLEAAKAAEKLANERAEAAEQERQRALHFARQQSETASRSMEARDQSERDLVNNALQAAQSELASAKAAQKSAYNAGDADGVVDSNERMGRASARILNLEGAAAELSARAEQEARAPARAEPPPQPQQPQPPQVSVIEAIDRDPALLPKEKVWLKNHPELIADQNGNHELMVGYQRAIRAGLVRGTPQYFAFLDEFMGYSEPTDDQEGKSIVSAPVSRQQPPSMGGSSINSNQVKLSQEQRAQARSIGVSDRAYAVQVQRLEKLKREDPERYPSRRS